MSGILDRVHRLLALAVSENENEARNAAVQACKLIKKHDLRLSHPHPTIAPSPSGEPVPPTRGTVVDLDELQAMVIKAKLSTPCLDCGERIDAGDLAWWMRGRGMVHHMKCDPDKLRRMK